LLSTAEARFKQTHEANGAEAPGEGAWGRRDADHFFTCTTNSTESQHFKPSQAKQLGSNMGKLLTNYVEAKPIRRWLLRYSCARGFRITALAFRLFKHYSPL